MTRTPESSPLPPELIGARFVLEPRDLEVSFRRLVIATPSTWIRMSVLVISLGALMYLTTERLGLGLLFMLAMALVYSGIILAMPRRYARRTTIAPGPQSWSFGPLVAWQTEVSRHEVQWPYFTRVVELPEHLLFRAGVITWCVPKRGLHPYDLERLRHLLRAQRLLAGS